VLTCLNSGALLVSSAAVKAKVMQRVVADMQALAIERSDKCLDPAGIVDRRWLPPVTSPGLYYRAIDRFGDPVAGLPIADRADFENARRHLLRLDCTPIYT
jgi:hypothetical protein